MGVKRGVRAFRRRQQQRPKKHKHMYIFHTSISSHWQPKWVLQTIIWQNTPYTTMWWEGVRWWLEGSVEDKISCKIFLLALLLLTWSRNINRFNGKTKCIHTLCSSVHTIDSFFRRQQIIYTDFLHLISFSKQIRIPSKPACYISLQPYKWEKWWNSNRISSESNWK